MRNSGLGLALLILTLASCEKQEMPVAESQGLFFEKVDPTFSGIDFSNSLSENGDLNIIEYLYYYNGGGVGIGDFNNDGLEDIYFTANQAPDRLYLNLGGLKFKDVTEAANIKIDSTWSTGVAIEDVNNDGYADIYVSKVGNYKNLRANNLLYLNNGATAGSGQVTFTEVSEKTGLNFSGFSTQAAFLDYDKDGDMDMYLMNHSVHSTRSYGNAKKRTEKDSLSGDRFFENKLESGTLKFVDVTEKVGIFSSPLGYGLALVATDINQDGLMDIYVGNDFHENDYLYINQGPSAGSGQVTFKEDGEAYLNHTSRFTMGVDVADMDNDTDPDLFTLDMMPDNPEVFLKSGGEDSDKVSAIKENFGFRKQYARNTFQLNQDNKSFADIAPMTNTHATDWSWAVLLEDYDNDGLKDIFITNGIYKRPNDLDYINYLSNVDFSAYDKDQSKAMEKKLIETMPTLKISNVLFRNKGNMPDGEAGLDFERLTTKVGLEPSYSNGAATADLDNDGDLDLVVNTINAIAEVLENKSDISTENKWLGLILEGDKSNAVATGSKVTVYAEGRTFYKELITTRGFQSTSTKKLHFGLGDTKTVDSVKIVWPDGGLQKLTKLGVNQYQTVKRNANGIEEYGGDLNSRFEIVAFPYNHIENAYLDYEREPLMPEKLSTEGPAAITADFNEDGFDDIFIGGGNLQSASFFVQDDKGGYSQKNIAAFTEDQVYEDVDAAAFDFENDGDLDIYVVSGGNENIEGHPNLEDRLYLNDGKGNFERFKSTLPKFNGSTVSAADFNGDGFDDLFIGSRSIPGAYGLSPYSLILKNTGESSFEIVQKTRFGMVTDSQWADMNNDGLQDLILVGDWMPVTVLINKGDATFENRTKDLGLENTNGLCNTILVADINGNGSRDIIAGNTGLNIKWKASVEKPIKLYQHDFDENEQLDPLIFYDFYGQYVPFANKDVLMTQIPMLKKKFLSYTDFSKIKSLEDLTGKAEKDILETKSVEELRSMVYYNSDSTFTAKPLPKEAQMSSIEDFYLEGKGPNPSLLFVGNYFGYVNELGDNDANAGGILTTSKNSAFKDYRTLPLDKNLSVRKILALGANKYLIISNNAKAFVLQKNRS